MPDITDWPEWQIGGDGGIRTLDKVYTLRRFSKPIPKRNLSQGSDFNSSSLAFHNGFTGQTTHAPMDELNRRMREARNKLVRQPAIARVVIIDEDSRKQTYFICSGTPEGGPIGVTRPASYNPPSV